MTEITELRVRAALSWIVGILSEMGMPYQLVGGMAARVHGATRPVADIDLYIPASRAAELAERLKDYVSKPLRHYQEAAWDIQYFQIIYQGQKIEFGVSPGAKFLPYGSKEWVAQEIDFTKSIAGKFGDTEVFVMPRDELILYKKLLNREVDRIDIEQMEKAD